MTPRARAKMQARRLVSSRSVTATTMSARSTSASSSTPGFAPSPCTVMRSKWESSSASTCAEASITTTSCSSSQNFSAKWAPVWPPPMIKIRMNPSVSRNYPFIIQIRLPLARENPRAEPDASVPVFLIGSGACAEYLLQVFGFHPIFPSQRSSASIPSLSFYTLLIKSIYASILFPSALHIVVSVFPYFE